MATIDSSITGSQRAMISTALTRAPTIANSGISILRSPRTDYQRRCIMNTFGVSAGIPAVPVINAYSFAANTLNNSQCLISIRPGFTGWGYCPATARSGFTREIQVGTQFLSGNAGGWGGVVAGCPRPNDVGALRATTLIHEAIHWRFGPGHAGLGLQRNPYNYETFIFAIRCGRSTP